MKVFKFLDPSGKCWIEINDTEIISNEIDSSHLNVDLTKLLQGHEGEKFWSPCWGECEFLEIHSRSGGRPMLKFRAKNGECRNVTPSGCLGYGYEGIGGECIIWPSKEHQSWGGYNLLAVKKSSGELEIYIGDPKLGKLYITTYGFTDLLMFLNPGEKLQIS